jgi:hypothetical protein
VWSFLRQSFRTGGIELSAEAVPLPQCISFRPVP